MFARYDQDLTPYFERIRAVERARRSEQRAALRHSLGNLLSLFSRCQKA